MARKSGPSPLKKPLTAKATATRSNGHKRKAEDHDGEQTGRQQVIAPQHSPDWQSSVGDDDEVEEEEEEEEEEEDDDDDDDDEEDEVDDDDVTMDGFRDEIAGDRKDLSGLLQEGLREAANDASKHRNEVASLILEALSWNPTGTNASGAGGGRAYSRHITLAGTHIAVNPAFSTAVELLGSAKDLMAECNRLGEVITGMKARDEGEALVEKWERDVEETERLIGLGRRIAVRNVESLLDVESAREAGQERDGYEVKKGAVTAELARSLRYAERGVKRMVKGLPLDGI